MVMKVDGLRGYIPRIGDMTGGDTMSRSMGDFGASGLPPVPSAGVNPLAHLNQVGTIQPTIPQSFPMIHMGTQPDINLSQPQPQPL